MNLQHLHDQMLWSDVIQSYMNLSEGIMSKEEFDLARRSFLSNSQERSAILKSYLGSEPPGDYGDTGTRVAIGMVQELTEEELKSLLPQLIYRMCNLRLRSLDFIRAPLLSLPHQWLADHVEEAADLVLQTGLEVECGILLAFCRKVDLGLYQRVARKAAQSTDQEVRELGRNALEQVGESTIDELEHP